MRRRFVMRFALPLVVAVGTVIVGPPQAAFAGTINVTTTADEFNENPAACSLREAIDAANDDLPNGGCPAGSGADTINVPAGTYVTTRPPAPTGGGDLDVESELTIAGAGASTTVIDGGGLDRVINVTSPGVSVTISGVTIQNGATSGSGGGIRSVAALTLQGVAISGNSSGGDGGGLDSTGAAAVLTLADSTLSANHADGRGGGLENSGGTASLSNVTVSGNTTNGSGGGIWDALGGTLNLNNVTVARNTANLDAMGGGDGGGIATDGAAVNVGNSIVGSNDDASTAGAQEPDCSGTLNSQGYNLIGDITGCTIAGSKTGNITGENPGLDPLANNGGPTSTHALRSNSPAIDAGSPAAPGSGGTACEAADQRGVDRPQGKRCDIGSFERQGPGGGPKCLGVAVTISGTSGPDNLNGTNKRDGIEALGGNDSIKAQGGKDGVCAGDGKDVARGDTGNDKITGQGGNDRAIGGGGADLLKGGGGNDRLRGKKKDDTLRGGAGNDRLNGGPGFDVCKGGPGRDRFRSCEERTG